ncbi:unnamed protein product [Knipowitschia caucasica]|uniref:Stimulator of interferon genes protein n=1 Tax=Knipowitschia caucasica TaxID=637954 RepID=A0AAV2MLJ8_KNICA
MQSLRSQSELVPEPRGRLPKVCAVAAAAVSIAMTAIFVPGRLVGWVSMATLLLSLGPLVHGCFLCLDELLHHRNRYRGRSVLQPLCDCGLRRSVVWVVLSALLLCLSGSPLPPFHLWTLLWLCPVLHAAYRSLGVLSPSELELSDVCESRRTNVAHGLAWSFYLGYLQLVLPNLEESISAFCASHLSSAPLWSRGSRRLFILVPLNANISHKLEDEDERVQFYDNLPNSRLDRAGVRGRVYKHSVYRVLSSKGQAQTCVVEYATPLLTLYGMSQDASAGFGEPQRRQQVLLFYRTLQELLERSLECRNKYTLILLNDEHEGDPHYLSQCILRHLQQQSREEYPMAPVIPLPQQEGGGSLPNAPMAPGQQDLSPEPTLMFSLDKPRSLRDPMEVSEGYNPSCTG